MFRNPSRFAETWVTFALGRELARPEIVESVEQSLKTIERNLHGISYDVSGLRAQVSRKKRTVERFHWLMTGFKTLELFIILAGCAVQTVYMRHLCSFQKPIV